MFVIGRGGGEGDGRCTPCKQLVAAVMHTQPELHAPVYMAQRLPYVRHEAQATVSPWWQRATHGALHGSDQLLDCGREALISHLLRCSVPDGV